MLDLVKILLIPSPNRANGCHSTQPMLVRAGPGTGTTCTHMRTCSRAYAYTLNAVYSPYTHTHFVRVGPGTGEAWVAKQAFNQDWPLVTTSTGHVPLPAPATSHYQH